MIVNSEVIFWVRKCLRTHLFNILIKIPEIYTIYIFWHKALGYTSHDLLNLIDMFSNGNLIPTQLKNCNYDSCLQSKFSNKISKSLLDHMKLKFNVIHSDVHGLLGVQLLGGK
jgi:hypothetical protein